MKHSRIPMSIVVMLVMISLAYVSRATAIPQLQISEIMFNPDGDENAREFVELYNPGGIPVELIGWMIGDNDALDDIIPVQGGSVIPAGSYALVLDPDYFDSGEPYEIPTDTILLTIDDNAIGSRGLSNSTAETVYLVSAAGDTVAAVTYDLSCPPGYSWEMLCTDGGMGSSNFAPSSVPEGTPGYRNSVASPRLNPALDSSSIILGGSDFIAGEILSGTVSYMNAGSEPLEGIEVALAIAPDSPLGTCRFDDMVAPGERSAACGFTSGPLPGGALELIAVISAPHLDQPAGDDTVCVSLPVAIPPGTIILNEVMAAPADGPEWIELYNSGERPVDLYGWRVTDSTGAVSDASVVHRFVNPDGFFILTAGETGWSQVDTPVIALSRFPALNNDGDTVVLLDHKGTTADSMLYTSARIGVSFERITDTAGGSRLVWDYSTASGGATPGGLNSIAWNDEDVAGSGARLAIEPNPFLDTTELSYTLPFPLARVTLTVYDRRGRLAATLREGEESGSTWRGSWNGRGDNGRLPAGPYILSLEALDKQTGRMVRIREMLVVAAEL